MQWSTLGKQFIETRKGDTLKLKNEGKCTVYGALFKEWFNEEEIEKVPKEQKSFLRENSKHRQELVTMLISHYEVALSRDF
ncbi:hypothetical protein TNCV_3685771 [Trichonephila clavipes]|nr:hypothetical protein TNCV_3685771 [Trichonephila clavipes]